MKNNAMLTLWLAQETREELDAIAHQERKSLSALARGVFDEFVARWKEEHTKADNKKTE